MKKRYLLLSFMIPVIMVLLIFVCNGIIFDSNSIFFGDAQYQYYQVLFYFKDILSGISNVFYSFQVGFGSSMISTIAYYVLSPFNLLLSLFSYENIEIFAILSIVVRIGLCGLSMYLYLFYNNKNKYSLLFSVCYALSFYIMANYYQLMWLDSYFLAPLLLLGIDKLIKEKKCLLYGVVLFLIILTNYYMGYMCALFSVLYFVYKFILEEKRNKDVIKNFILTSIFSGLMTMFVHIPNLLQLVNIERINFRNYFFNIDILGILSKLFLGSNIEGGFQNEYHPYLYIGLVNIILLFFYFINNKINKKEKILSFVLIVILFLSIIFVPLNNFWHALSSPIGFNFRYMYLFNIVIIDLCHKSFINIKNINTKWFYVFFLMFVILSNLIIIRSIMNYIYIYISVILVLIYLILLKQKDKDSKILFIFLVIAELFFNGYTVLKVNDLTNRKYINGRYNEKIETLDIINDNTFHRTEFNKKFAFNDPLNYGYYGVTGWLSSVDINQKFYNKIGYYSFNNTGFYNESIVLDSLFGIKYYETIYENDYYELIGSNKISVMTDFLYGVSYYDSYIYKNPYALNLGYMVSSKVKESFDCLDGFDCQNTMLNNMTGNFNNVFMVKRVFDNKLIISSDKDFYILLKDHYKMNSSYEVCVNDICQEINATSNRSIYFKNDYRINEELDIKVSGNDNIDIYVAYVDFEKFKENFDVLKTNQLNIEEYSDGYVKGNIEVSDNKILFLSIPYEKGWNIYVDGVKVDYYKLFDTFIGLDLESGYHEIEMIYRTPGLKLGVAISLISMVLFISYMIYVKKKMK